MNTRDYKTNEWVEGVLLTLGYADMKYERCEFALWG